MMDNNWAEVNVDELFVHGCESPKEEEQTVNAGEQEVLLTAAQL